MVYLLGMRSITGSQIGVILAKKIVLQYSPLCLTNQPPISENWYSVMEWPNLRAFYVLMRFITLQDRSAEALGGKLLVTSLKKAFTDRKTALMLFDNLRALLAPYTDTHGAGNIEGARLENCGAPAQTLLAILLALLRAFRD